jgi:hypothetical protein
MGEKHDPFRLSEMSAGDAGGRSLCRAGGCLSGVQIAIRAPAAAPPPAPPAAVPPPASASASVSVPLPPVLAAAANRWHRRPRHRASGRRCGAASGREPRSLLRYGARRRRVRGAGAAVLAVSALRGRTGIFCILFTFVLVPLAVAAFGRIASGTIRDAGLTSTATASPA